MEFKPLPERPEAQVLSVEDILQRAATGRIRVPRLQRGFRWERSNILDLFDSVVRGYPVGSILVNQAAASAESVLLGSLALQVPETPDAWWLVDGQQRVTSLVAALLHPNPDVGDKFSVRVNLRTNDFDTGRPPSADWLSLSILGDRAKLLQWSRSLHAGDDTEALVTQAFALEKAITQYKVTVFAVRNADATTVRAIFGRVNRAGVPLKENEVVDALFGDDDRGKPLQQLATDLDTASGFGRLDEAWLLRCVKAVGGYAPGQRFDERHQLTDDLVARTRESLAGTLTFLQQDARIPHAAVLPYRLPLIVLATVFDRHPRPSDRSRELLVRWIWRGAVSQLHAKSSIADVVSHTSAIGDDEDESVQSLLGRVPRDVSPPSPWSHWNAKAAFPRLYACALLATPPLDRVTLEPVTRIAKVLRGKMTLSDLFQDPVGSSAIAGRIYWPHPLETLLDADPAVLASLGIDEGARAAIADGDAHGYLSSHGAWAELRVAECLARYGGIGADDRPRVASLLARAHRA